MSSQAYIFNPTERTSAAAGDGFSAPRLTSTDRLALSLGVNGKGMMVYDTTLLALYLWNGTAWVAFPASGYSQGVWSPAFLPATGTITLDPANATGIWSRIGNTVTVVGNFKVQSISSPTGSLTLTNLPFAPVTGFEAAACVTVNGLNNLARTSISGTILGSAVQIYHYDSGSLDPIAVHVLAGSDWYISGTYITT